MNQNFRNRFKEYFPKIDEWDKKILKKIYFKYENKKKYRKIAKIISYFGDPRLWIIVLVTTFIYGLIIKNLLMCFIFGSAFFQSYFIYYIIKRFFSRTRPFIELSDEGIKNLDKTGHGLSFPSGHSHHSTLLICMFILWFGPYNKNIYFIIILILICYNIAIPYSRIISGCHYPSDVIFAIIEAYLAVFLFWFITRPIYFEIYNLFFLNF